MSRFEVDRLHLFASDPVTTARWYRDMLGAKIEESCQSDGQHRIDMSIGNLRIYVADGPRLEQATGELLAPSRGGVHYGLDHLVLLTEGVDAAVGELRAAGVRIVYGPKTLRPGARAAYIEAPDNVLIEILSRDLQVDLLPPAQRLLS